MRLGPPLVKYVLDLSGLFVAETGSKDLAAVAGKLLDSLVGVSGD